jgi:predicted ATP-dependent Lon-type protease
LDEYPEKFDRLLCGGIWCIVQLDYEVEGDNKALVSPTSTKKFLQTVF